MQLDQSVQNASDAIVELKDRLGRCMARIRNLRLSNQNLRLELENAELRHAREIERLRAYIRDLEGRSNNQLYAQYQQMQGLYNSQQAAQNQLAQLQYRQYQSMYDQGILGMIPDRQPGSILRDCTCVPGRQGLFYDNL